MYWKLENKNNTVLSEDSTASSLPGTGFTYQGSFLTHSHIKIWQIKRSTMLQTKGMSIFGDTKFAVGLFNANLEYGLDQDMKIAKGKIKNKSMYKN